MSDEHDHSHEDHESQPAGAAPPPGPAHGGRRLASAGRSVAQQFFHRQGGDDRPGGGFSLLRLFHGRRRSSARSFCGWASRWRRARSVLLGPGLHWAFPAPIDEVKKIPFTEIQTVKSTVGWYFTTPEMEAAGQELPAGAFVESRDGRIRHHRRTATSFTAARPCLTGSRTRSGTSLILPTRPTRCRTRWTMRCFMPPRASPWTTC